MAAPSHAQRLIHSSDDPNWRTPPDLFALLHREFAFTLDVAATSDASLCAHAFLGPGSRWGTNGLVTDWREASAKAVGRRAVCWMNPPYSRQRQQPIEPWIEKAREEANLGAVVVGLVPAAVQTVWWARHVWNKAHEIRLFPHRISFLTPEGAVTGNAGINHALVIWRPMQGFCRGFRSAVNYWTWRE